MSDGRSLNDIRAVAAAAATLAKDSEAFAEAYEAYRARDAGRFQSVLDRVGLGRHCERICYLFCEKRCVGRCYKLCREQPEAVDVEEIQGFVQAFAPVARNKRTLASLVAVAEKEDVRKWRAELKKHGLDRYCHQVCHFLCRERCWRICRELCARPEITRISSIPVSQFDSQGLGEGPSIPPFQVPPPNPAGGVGDHPVGGSSWLKGVFNMPSATQYKVEWSSNPGGPYAPITESVLGYNVPGIDVWRHPSGGADPGWLNIAEIPLSDGGPGAAGEKTLLYWPTPSDGTYYLRLWARDGSSSRVSGPRVVRTDNTAPTLPQISLELKTPNGELKPLKCGQVKEGDGLIRITVQASDPNFGRLTVNAQGASSLSVPVVAVPEGTSGPAVPLAKTYNGNTADTGYPVPTSFLWDPWSDPKIVPCCYVVRIDIWDRAVINNAWGGGHHRAGWEAIEIGF